MGSECVISKLTVRDFLSVGLKNLLTKVTVAKDGDYTGYGQLLLTGKTDPNKQLRIGYDTTNNYGFIRALWVGQAESNLVFNLNGSKVGFGIVPTSVLHSAGSFALPLVTKTTAYTLTANDYTVLCNAAGGAFNINLPTAVGIAGRIYNIKKIDSSANAITADAAGTETIDGALTQSLSVQYESITIQSDGANWHII